MTSDFNTKKGANFDFTLKENNTEVVPRTGQDKRNSAIADREEQVNDLLDVMKEPLKNEQNNKIKYRKWILIIYLAYFLLITIAVFGIILLFTLSEDGITDAKVKICQILIAGLFVNLLSLAVVIFKYLFDDKNSLMKDVIQLMVETLKEKEN